uniref:flavodoxin-dependent (E)-4-hydroxy-3-methylbut-2-enyl-diphosphate synthase n=1 Tax=Nocardia abscessus TaxID=120957 RepID=UPI002456D087
MYAASREASARSREALRAALTGSDSAAATTGSELFAVVAVLDDQRSLRVALADVSVPGFGAAGAAGIPIRIGVNAGSLDKRMLEKYGKATPEALVE